MKLQPELKRRILLKYLHRLFAGILMLAAVVYATFGYLRYEIDHDPVPSLIPYIARAEGLVASMTDEELVGQLFIIDLRRESGQPVLEVTRRVTETFRTYGPGGVVLFGENIDTVEQTTALISGLRELSPYPLTIGVDYEGGVVSRLTTSGKIPATRIPPAAEIGAFGDTGVAYEIGTVMARELNALGFTMNFAPVADVLSNPESMIGNRSFSSDPVVTARMVAAMVEGLQDSGISSVVKHFPGHGNVAGDTHDGLVVLDRTGPELESTEFIPFATAIASCVDGIMTAHIAVPEITGEDIPTTFSPEMITGTIREELGHEGLVITDSLVMKAIRSRWDSGESAVRAFLAGADIVLQPLDLEGARDGVLEALRTGRLSRERVRTSVIRAMKLKLIRSDLREDAVDPYQILGCEEHMAVMAKLPAKEDRD